MSESIQIMPSASAGAQQSKISPLDSVNNPESTDDSTGFTAVFASYVESETDASEQQVEQNLAEFLNELLPQEELADGNTLPEQDQAVMMQALMLLQPAEKVLSNPTLSSSSMQSISLLDSPRKPMLNSQSLNQDYFLNGGLQNKDFGNALLPGLATNSITAQLSAAHFMPEKNESILLNMSEQLMPVQTTNSTLAPALAAVGLGTATQAATTQTQMAPLNLGQNAWETNLGSRLQMMVGQNIQTAEIRLDPPELGALEIKIKVTNDVASVNITSPHSQVREALETAVPRLREMFAESGVSLGDVNVQQESFAQQQNSAEEGARGLGQLVDSDLVDEPVEITRKIISDSLLDTYA